MRNNVPEVELVLAFPVNGWRPVQGELHLSHKESWERLQFLRTQNGGKAVKIIYGWRRSVKGQALCAGKPCTCESCTQGGLTLKPGVQEKSQRVCQK